MKYPLMPGQTVEYLVLHALECGMPDVWSVRKHLLLQGPDYMLLPRQISGALQRLKRDGIVANKSKRERDRWKLVHNARQAAPTPYNKNNTSPRNCGHD